MWNLKNQMSKPKAESDLYIREQTDGYQWEEGGGMDKMGQSEWEIQVSSYRMRKSWGRKEQHREYGR